MIIVAGALAAGIGRIIRSG